MGLKDLWKDKVNGEDIVDAADINNIAHAVIQLEDEGRVIEETDPTVPSWAKQTSKPTYSKSEVGLGNVENVKQYSASNPPPYPVTSVNGKTGAVTVTVPTKVSELANDSEYITEDDVGTYILDSSEEWTFTLADGSTVTKKVVIA